MTRSLAHSGKTLELVWLAGQRFLTMKFGANGPTMSIGELIGLVNARDVGTCNDTLLGGERNDVIERGTNMGVLVGIAEASPSTGAAPRLKAAGEARRCLSYSGTRRWLAKRVTNQPPAVNDAFWGRVA